MSKLKFESLPDYGDKFKLQDFKSNCIDGSFIDYDGDGYLSDGKRISNILIKPSMLKRGMKIPKWATHIIWFNR